MTLSEWTSLVTGGQPGSFPTTWTGAALGALVVGWAVIEVASWRRRR